MTDSTRGDGSLMFGILVGVGAAVILAIVVALLGEIGGRLPFRLLLRIGFGFGAVFAIHWTIATFSGGWIGFRVAASAALLAIPALAIGTLALPLYHGDVTLGSITGSDEAGEYPRLFFPLIAQTIGAVLAAVFMPDE